MYTYIETACLALMTLGIMVCTLCLILITISIRTWDEQALFQRLFIERNRAWAEMKKGETQPKEGN